MNGYLNPFRTRASEQLRDTYQFVRTFGAGAVDLLPEAIWDRLVILRSSPGFGKTSLMRLFTGAALETVRRSGNDDLAAELTERDVLSDGRPTKLGVLIPLDRDYLSLLDLGVGREVADRLLFRLLDVRVMLAMLRAAVEYVGGSVDDVERVTLRMRVDDPAAKAAAERLGGITGTGIYAYARTTERALLGLVDSVTPIVVNRDLGHREMLSLRVLSDADILVGDSMVEAQPLIMFDDGQALEDQQRLALLDQLVDRKLTVARWYAERYEALSQQELLATVGTRGRDVEVVDLERIARDGSPDGRRFQKGRYERVLGDIAVRRAGPILDRYAEESQDFFALLEDDRSQLLEDRGGEIIAELRGRAAAAAEGDSIYAEWFAEADGLHGYEAALRWRETEILIHRDRARQRDIFAEPLPPEEVRQRSNAAIREAAALQIATEFELPYYAGADIITKLGSHNAEQFLDLCGDLFEEMLVDIRVGRSPQLLMQQQDRVIRTASRRYWEDLPRRVPNGRDVQLLVKAIVAIARADNEKPTVPYPPGVTGTALLMAERDQLLDPSIRTGFPGGDRLFDALAAAVSRNVLSAVLDYSVKNNKYMVLYLNRLLCPQFNLPLGFGSFRERRLRVMAQWMVDGDVVAKPGTLL